MNQKLGLYLKVLQEVLEKFREGDPASQEGRKGAQKVCSHMRKELDSMREKMWMVELLTLEALVRHKHYYTEIFQECDLHEMESKTHIEEMSLT